MTSAIAEKKAADARIDDIQREDAPAQAISINLPFEAVRGIIEAARPLRRPNRNRPVHLTLNDETAAWEAASDEAWDSIED